jgi:predicted lipoprotein
MLAGSIRIRIQPDPAKCTEVRDATSATDMGDFEGQVLGQLDRLARKTRASEKNKKP